MIKSSFGVKNGVKNELSRIKCLQWWDIQREKANDSIRSKQCDLLFFIAGPVDGEWGDWTPWSQCSQTCGISGGQTLSRTRVCNRPPPMNGGKPCDGNSTQTAQSCLTPCPGGFEFVLVYVTSPIFRNNLTSHKNCLFRLKTRNNGLVLINT